MNDTESISQLIQRLWKKRENRLTKVTDYPGSLSIWQTAIIDGEPKLFRVIIREFTEEEIKADREALQTALADYAQRSYSLP